MCFFFTQVQHSLSVLASHCEREGQPSLQSPQAHSLVGAGRVVVGGGGGGCVVGGGGGPFGM